IAILDGSTDREYHAIRQDAIDARARAEAIQATLDIEAAEAALIAQTYEGELLPDDNDNNDVDPIWFDESIWTPPYRLMNINARASLPPLSSPPEFVPGRGFTTYPIRPALQAPSMATSLSVSVPPIRALPRALLQCSCLRQRSSSPERPDSCSPLLMVLHVQALQSYFPDYLAELTLKEFGRPPYPKYLRSLFTDDFLHLLTEPVLVSVLSVSSEPVPAPTTVPDLPESSIVIEWDDQQPLIELIHPSAESAPSFPVSPPIVADSVMSAPRATACLAPTENEHRLARTEGLNKPNFARRALPEPLPIV
ncbi:MAG: hypothetical protein GY847_39385, partial [Proteobacteria bacterium]|nr:hypothetical protein [Pseudomonadota bacterium]